METIHVVLVRRALHVPTLELEEKDRRGYQAEPQGIAEVRV